MIEIVNTKWENYTNLFENKFFDLALTDPPYFSGPEKKQYYGSKVSKIGVKRIDYIKEPDCWEVPDKSYFDELYRVSEHQIIWGCNYYSQFIKSPGRIIWDKVKNKTTFSEAELASCSFHNTVKIFKFMWNGMLQGKSIQEGHIAQGNKKLNEKRIHHTQKPVALYDWTLERYAKKGFKVLDTHVGSGSIIISCLKAGIDLYCCEKSKSNFKNTIIRVDEFLGIKRDYDNLPVKICYP